MQVLHKEGEGQRHNKAFLSGGGGKIMSQNC